MRAAWRRGSLAEVPAGIAWDVVRLPAVLGPETVRHLRTARLPFGPVLATPRGTEFIVALGTADIRALPDAAVLPHGTPVLMPHPSISDPYRVGGRGWLVGPSDRPLTRGPDLAAAYALARTDTAAALV